ncbi:MAG: PSD1 and planctomycete cytochrome C domain-containing protein [Blastocatellia bacterium]|nr:PSD1 and planctomycete cytochrome C domain-containing protein [Blastocatellia bacterium]
MKTRFKAILAIAILGAAALSQWTVSARYVFPGDEQSEFFEKKIRPILATSCGACHNAKARVAGLDLSSAEGFARGGESGALIDKEKPEESRLLKVVHYDGPMKMPPTGKLKEEEIAALTAWVKMGAVWPGAEKPVAAAAAMPKNATVRGFTEKEKAFWSFQPMKQTTPPQVKNAAWVKSPIDRFILQKLEGKGISPAAPADRLTLLRRATLDLTGLPPTEAEIRDFLADASPDAFQKVVERLLASPRYGERWGRHWLDVARYADSTGNDEDHRYPFAWKYRDYVIESFNRDLPYDQFVREQLAGDLLPPAPGEKVNRRGIVATGFLALGPKAVAQQDKMKMLYDVYDEQVDVTSKAFLGLTLACARCHNHKFDPLLTRDYYAMTGIFASTRSFTNPDSHVSIVLEKPLVPADEWAVFKAARKAHQAKERRERVAIEEILDAVKAPIVRRNGERLAEYMLAARRVYQESVPLADAAKAGNLEEEILKRWVEELKPGDLTPQHLLEWRGATAEKAPEVARGYQQRFLTRMADWNGQMEKWRVEYRKALAENKETLPDRPTFEAGDDRFFDQVYFSRSGPFGISEKEQARFTPEQWAQLGGHQKALETLKKSAPAEPEMACAIEDGESVPQKVFIRGDYNNRGDEAPKSFPAILADFDTRPTFSGSGRLQLADWMVQPEHPLTARVMVNRIWQWHFGEGIVRTPDNFGLMGERPSHPELLDYLARAFVANGWSVKSMHRMIMLSSTYQMASINPRLPADADSDNRLLSRFSRRRLSVEEMRDGLLAIDGSIDLTMGGSLQAGRGTDGENNQGRLSLNPEKVKRRTVYLPLRRANLPTLLNLFDFGDATSMAGKRQLTNVATQALFWLNSDFLTEHSTAVAKSLLTEEAPDAVRVEKAWLRIVNRRPETDDVSAALKYIEGYQRKFPGEKAVAAAWQSYCRVLMASNDFIYVD